ncbi:hypothetical protein FRC08_008476 [Ceratobasidium sp. 394]|nr:hypothetical protein FRC08_008476 [Ceratobasidium sp. 394]
MPGAPAPDYLKNYLPTFFARLLFSTFFSLFSSILFSYSCTSNALEPTPIALISTCAPLALTRPSVPGLPASCAAPNRQLPIVISAPGPATRLGQNVALGPTI